MVKREELYFESRDNVSRIYSAQWIPDTDKPICILQIIHGMAEHVERYDDFARAMAEKGILVVGEDHLGHGKTAGESGTKGYFCVQDPATVVVRDSHRLKKLTQEKYPGVPYIILGHSMGSFILRNYLCRYGTGIQGAIIVGTGTQSGIVIAFGMAVAALQKLFCGSQKESVFLDRQSFRGYNKRIKDEKSKAGWLTKDKKIADAYIDDDFCGFTFTINGFQTLFELLARLNKKGNLKNMPPELPVLFASGAEDPVGNYGKGVKAVYQSFLDLGMNNVQLKLYENDRHEILNETDKLKVYEDIYSWILSVL